MNFFGSPKKVFSDNGGDFIGEKFYEMCEAFNIKVSGTPSYSPWSNGLCERHNRTLTETLLKVKEDTKSNWEAALAWAVCAKNAMINKNGFSPSQLVFGRNTNLPSTFIDKLPALDGQPISFTVGPISNYTRKQVPWHKISPNQISSLYTLPLAEKLKDFNRDMEMETCFQNLNKIIWDTSEANLQVSYSNRNSHKSKSYFQLPNDIQTIN